MTLTNKHLNYLRREYKIEETVDNYVSQEYYIKYIHKTFPFYITRGDFYTLKLCKNKIEKLDLSETRKRNLIKFLDYIARYGIDNARKTVSTNTFRKNMQQLEELNINPIRITIPMSKALDKDYIENPFKL